MFDHDEPTSRRQALKLLQRIMTCSALFASAVEKHGPEHGYVASLRHLAARKRELDEWLRAHRG